jgi:hypothetical protein
MNERYPLMLTRTTVTPAQLKSNFPDGPRQHSAVIRTPVDIIGQPGNLEFLFYAKTG